MPVNEGKDDANAQRQKRCPVCQTGNELSAPECTSCEAQRRRLQVCSTIVMGMVDGARGEELEQASGLDRAFRQCRRSSWSQWREGLPKRKPSRKRSGDEPGRDLRRKQTRRHTRPDE